MHTYFLIGSGQNSKITLKMSKTAEFRGSANSYMSGKCQYCVPTCSVVEHVSMSCSMCSTFSGSWMMKLLSSSNSPPTSCKEKTIVFYSQKNRQISFLVTKWCLQKPKLIHFKGRNINNLGRIIFPVFFYICMWLQKKSAKFGTEYRIRNMLSPPQKKNLYSSSSFLLFVFLVYDIGYKLFCVLSPEKSPFQVGCSHIEKEVAIGDLSTS